MTDRKRKYSNIGSFLVIAVELALVLLLIRVFKIEQMQRLPTVAPLIFFGFLVNAWLPTKLRPLFFVAVSLAAIFISLGFHLWFCAVAIGLVLIGLCHLTVALWVRVALILAVGAVLAAIRGNWIPLRGSDLFFSVFGSIFMFRLIIYLYDIRHEKKPVSVWKRLGYFFLLPNACFPLFPVVDYQSYLRTYYDREPNLIYQKGVQWIFKGVVHLLLYRVVYYHLIPAPSAVENAADVAVFIVATYLLYLRISGQFHMIAGILCLFGFDLPTTHNWYFLSSSITDFWRRINVYWKDFMSKIFYMPMFMRLRRLGMTPALVLSTAFVFAATWLLHSYQWFWLRGSFPIAATDGLFWGILGALVIANSIWESKKGRQRNLGASEKRPLRDIIAHSLKVLGMFCLMSVLWSLWNSESVGEWTEIVSSAKNFDAASMMKIVAALVALPVAMVVSQYIKGFAAYSGATGKFWVRAAAVSAASLGIIAMGTDAFKERAGENVASFIDRLAEDQLNQRDRDVMARGYYEGLLNTERLTSRFWQAEMNKPDDWVLLTETRAVRHRADILMYELRPSVEMLHKGVILKTNRFGMRDRDYEKKKPAGTYRIALLGASYEMGEGVPMMNTFENLVEDRLNQQKISPDQPKFEILNFSVTGYGVFERVGLCYEKLDEFSPDAVFYISHITEIPRSFQDFPEMLSGRIAVPRPLRDFFLRAGLTPGENAENIKQNLVRFIPHIDEFLSMGYGAIADNSKKNKILPVWISVPLNEVHASIAKELLLPTDKREAMAKKAGFVTLKLDGAFEGHPIKDITIAPWDTHPNEKGHKLLADKLYEELIKNKKTLGLDR